MISRQCAGIDIAFDKEGYFIDSLQWNNDIAIVMAREEGLILTERHLAVLTYMRDRYFQAKKVSLRNINHSGIVTLKDFYAMFPGAPLRTASRLAGLPKPESCV
jgi:dissimilatory sulfite reductase related protein